MRTVHKTNIRFWAIFALLLSVCLAACSDGKLFPVWAAPSTDENTTGPRNTDMETDTGTLPSDDSDSDQILPLDSDTEFPTDSDLFCPPEARCLPSWTECGNIIQGKDCPVRGDVCCAPPPGPCEDLSHCVAKNSQECAFKVIWVEDRYCNRDYQVCCSDVVPSQAECEYFFPSNSCVSSIDECISERNGTPHAAWCPTAGQICCYQPQPM